MILGRCVVVVLLLLAVSGPRPVAAETWTIDSTHTVSGFTVRHMMITNVTGVFESTAGTIDYVPGQPTSVKADITIEAKTINTRNNRRDTDLRSDNFLDAEKFPAITFRSKRVQEVRADGFDLVGDLTIRDVTREDVLKVVNVSGAVRDPRGIRRVGATASTTINRKDFGVNWNRAIEAGGVVVGDEVKINLEVQAVERKG